MSFIYFVSVYVIGYVQACSHVEVVRISSTSHRVGPVDVTRAVRLGARSFKG